MRSYIAYLLDGKDGDEGHDETLDDQQAEDGDQVPAPAHHYPLVN